MEREAHVRAAVVDGVDRALVAEEGQGAPIDVDDAAAVLLHLGESRGPDQTLGTRYHDGAPFGVEGRRSKGPGALWAAVEGQVAGC